MGLGLGLGDPSHGILDGGVGGNLFLGPALLKRHNLVDEGGKDSEEEEGLVFGREGERENLLERTGPVGRVVYFYHQSHNNRYFGGDEGGERGVDGGGDLEKKISDYLTMGRDGNTIGFQKVLDRCQSEENYHVAVGCGCRVGGLRVGRIQMLLQKFKANLIPIRLGLEIVEEGGRRCMGRVGGCGGGCRRCGGRGGGAEGFDEAPMIACSSKSDEAIDFVFGEMCTKNL